MYVCGTICLSIDVCVYKRASVDSQAVLHASHGAEREQSRAKSSRTPNRIESMDVVAVVLLVVTFVALMAVIPFTDPLRDRTDDANNNNKNINIIKQVKQIDDRRAASHSIV